MSDNVKMNIDQALGRGRGQQDLDDASGLSNRQFFFHRKKTLNQADDLAVLSDLR